MNTSQNSIRVGQRLTYNDGRPGHQDVKAVVLEVAADQMRVQFEDRADSTVIGFDDSIWMKHLTFEATQTEARLTQDFNKALSAITSVAAKVGRLLSMSDCENCFADEHTMIDVINPETGLSWCYGKTLERIRLEYPGAQIMTVAAHCEAKAKRQDTPIEWLETTEERYWEMLEVLPPACMMGGGFLVGEPCDHHAMSGQPRFQGFVSGNGKYRQSSRPITRSEFQDYIRNRVEVV